MRKSIIVATSLLVFISNAQAQLPGIAWQNCLGGSLYDVALGSTSTNDGGVVVVGYSTSSDGDVQSLTNGDEDLWVVRLDSLGNILWEHALGGSDWDQGSDVVQTIDQGFLVSGRSDSNNGDVTGNHGLTDGWVVKLDSSGALVWQKTFGGSSSDYFQSILPVPSGDFLLAGITHSNDGDVSFHHGGMDCWVVKIDDSGNLLWESTYGGSAMDNLNRVVRGSNGDLWGVGGSRSVNGDVSQNQGLQDVWVFRTDSVGNLLWQNTFGGSNGDNGHDIIPLDNGVAVAALTSSFNGDVVGNNGFQDYWILRLDSTGTLLWQNCLGGNNADYPQEIITTTSGEFLVAGRTFSNDGDVSLNQGGHDFWLVNLDQNGMLISEKTYGGTLDEYCYDMTVNDAGSIYLSGMTVSNDGDVSGHHALKDYWVIKLGPSITTAVPNTNTELFAIVPNPSNGLIAVRLNEPTSGSISIFDVSGREIKSENFAGLSHDLDLSNQPKGVYFITLESEQGHWTEKVVVE